MELHCVIGKSQQAQRINAHIGPMLFSLIQGGYGITSPVFIKVLLSFITSISTRLVREKASQTFITLEACMNVSGDE